MSIQVRAIHLYSKDADTRTIEFKVGQLNVITGASKTGKSSVLDIIDYCLASSGCSIPTGTIRDNVVMFALELATEQGTVVTARKPPANGKKTTTTMYVGFRETTDTAPRLANLEPNSDIRGARSFLSKIAGIEENLTDPGEGTRERFAATIRHALYFVLQAQEEIANPELLFHSQGEQFIPQSIRDVLPYFLGVVDPEYVVKQAELRVAERRLRTLRRSQSDFQVEPEITPRMTALIREAQSVGLASRAGEVPTIYSEAIAFLAELTRAESSAPAEEGVDDSGGRLEELFSERARLRDDLALIRSESTNLRNLLSAHFGFNEQVAEHGARLRSVELLRISDGGVIDQNRCPVCASELAEPTTSVSDLLSELRSVEREIGQVRQNVPGIQTVIAENEDRIREIDERLRRNQQEIDAVVASQDLLQRSRDDAIQRAMIRGRISLYLEGASQAVDTNILADEINSLIATIEVLQFEIDAEQVQDRLASAVSRISTELHRLAQQIELEHSDSPVRLDTKRLTVVFDTPSGPRELNQIGSGENWLGYHVATLVAMHRFFIQQRRPVPRFLVLDQPSQVYFPPDRRPDEAEMADEDRAALSKMLGIVRDLIEEADGAFQAIVLDHADLDTDWFQDAVVERWRDGKKLVPVDWIEGN
ncbi:DUF3732 domain-containing protein [Lentzea flava]|uniref:Nuclease SbcCD subunit C n=1 Tax=Lentzea flava TaxID=103732 RepID=A0ABQ2UPJ4_9PSEU|nr:DUF3732 domain-containing protein [Lentzea flava]MCP2200820.1 Protein of unknown function (DUF3732) [Lentzea flava]GGU47636.1 hypothetical protein GCM10010178_45510 [Lentzea flava]